MISKWFGNRILITWSLFSLSNEVLRCGLITLFTFKKLLRCNLPHCSLWGATGMRWTYLNTIFTPWLQRTDWLAAESCTCIYTRCQHMIGWQVTADWLVAKHHGSIDDLGDDIIKASWLAYSLHHEYKVKVDCAILSLHYPCLRTNMRPAWHNQKNNQI